MGMTFLQQQNKLSSLLMDSNTSVDDQWDLATRKLELNRGELHFARETKILWGYATGTVSSQTISLPSDWLETFKLAVTVDSRDVIITNNKEIAIADLEDYEDGGDYHYYFWVNSSGTKQIKFASTAADGLTYKIWYFAKPTTTLSADTDESVFPDEYREASCYYAASELLTQIGKTQMSLDYRAKYQFYVDTAREEYEKHYLNPILANPQNINEFAFDSDTEGIGQSEDYRIY